MDIRRLLMQTLNNDQGSEDMIGIEYVGELVGTVTAAYNCVFNVPIVPDTTYICIVELEDDYATCVFDIYSDGTKYTQSNYGRNHYYVNNGSNNGIKDLGDGTCNVTFPSLTNGKWYENGKTFPVHLYKIPRMWG